MYSNIQSFPFFRQQEQYVAVDQQARLPSMPLPSMQELNIHPTQLPLSSGHRQLPLPSMQLPDPTTQPLRPRDYWLFTAPTNDRIPMQASSQPAAAVAVSPQPVPASPQPSAAASKPTPNSLAPIARRFKSYNAQAPKCKKWSEREISILFSGTYYGVDPQVIADTIFRETKSRRTLHAIMAKIARFQFKETRFSLFPMELFNEASASADQSTVENNFSRLPVMCIADGRWSETPLTTPPGRSL